MFMMFLPAIVLCGLAWLLVALGFFLFGYDDDFEMLFIITLAGSIFCCVILLICLYVRRTKYTFTEKEITVTKKREQYTIKVDDIKTMQYCQFRYRFRSIHFLYIFIIILCFFAGDASFGTIDSMQIYITDKNGKEYKLGYIIKKDAKRLEKMYPKLLKTIYELPKEKEKTVVEK